MANQQLAEKGCLSPLLLNAFVRRIWAGTWLGRGCPLQQKTDWEECRVGNCPFQLTGFLGLSGLAVDDKKNQENTPNESLILPM